MALTVEEADRMIAATEEAGVIAMIGQVIRFWPEYVAIRELLSSGQLGDVRAIDAVRLSAPPAWGTWFKDPSLSGGALIDLHIHDLDFIYSLCGMPDRVFATGLQGPTGGWDQVTTCLDYGKARAVAEGSFLMPDNFPFQMLFRLQGSKGTVEYRFRVAGQVGQRAEAETELVLYRPGTPPVPVASEKKDAYLAELEYWVECLRAGRHPVVAVLRQARDVLSIAAAARRSLETGETVAIPHVA
jgi:predicted dehydrogenase